MPVNNPGLKLQQCEAKHPNGYKYDKTNFNLGIKALNDFTCDVHGLFKKTLRDFLRVQVPCEQCRVNTRRLGLKEGIDYAENTTPGYEVSDDKSTITVTKTISNDGFVFGGWTLTKDDPKGPFKIEILFKDRVIQTFDYIVK